MPSNAHEREPFAALYNGLPVLVTGGLGFIGSNLVRRLVNLGARVQIVDAMISDHGGNLANLGGFEDRVQLNLADLRDPDAMRKLVAGQQIIFNVAGQVSHIDSMKDPATDLQINTLAQVVLLEACRECAPEATIVYASTRQIYGKPDYLPVDEIHPIRPVDANGINKSAGEAYHTLYHQVYGMRTVSLRLTNTYGPRMLIKNARQTFLGIWLRRVVEDGSFEVWGGQQRRDLAFIDDVVTAFLAAATAEKAWGQVYNLGGCPPVSLEDLARMLVEVAGSGRYEMREFPPERKRIDIGDYFADDRRFRELTGWTPTIDLRDGLARSVDYYRANLSSYL
jgi:nucleoside-diphosphate-sugar epimerase